MPLGTPVSEIATSGSGSLGTTASFSATSGDILIALAGAGKASSLPSAQSITDSEGLTWTQAVNATQSGSAYMRMQAWWAISNGNSMTATLTAGATAPDRAGLQILSLSGAVQSLSNTGSDGDGSGDPSPSLSTAPRSDSTVIGAFIINDGGNINPPSGFTEISDGKLGSGNDWAMEVCYDAGSASQSASWSENNSDALAILLEIRARRPKASAMVIVG